jgi:hypothetical protein
MRTHVVRDGEFMTQIAAKLGRDPEALWSDPSNADLKANRRHMDILCAGDIVHIPDEQAPEGLPIAKGTTNRYQAKVPRVTISIIARDGGTPLADEPYRVMGAGAPIEGTTDGDGRLTFKFPVHVREAEILLPRKGLSFPLDLGGMDPVDEASGVLKRLANLGFYANARGPDGGTEEEALRAALIAFQRANSLAATGELDSSTREGLMALHGC